MKYSKAYPYLKALLDALIEAAPNWMKAPGKFVSSLSEQLKDKGQEQNRALADEIKGISKDELRAIIKEAGCEQEENIEFIVEKVQSIPDILQIIDCRFDRVDQKLDQIESLLNKRPLQSKYHIAKQEAQNIYMADTINIHPPAPQSVDDKTEVVQVPRERHTEMITLVQEKLKEEPKNEN